MRECFTTAIFLLLAALCVGLPASAAVKHPGKVKVFVSILPAAYFVERVGGPNVEVSVLVGPGQEPHTFEPTPKLVAKLADAQVLFGLGFPFEETVVKKAGSTFKKLELVNLQQGIKLRSMTKEEAASEGAEHEHEHGHADAETHEHQHRQGEMDPHTWLNPKLAKIQARTIANTLIRIDPSHKAQYEKNLKKFQTDLDAVDEQLRKALAPVKGKSFFVFHPAFGYFGDEYGLKQVPVEIEGKEPTGKQIARLIDLTKKERIKIIFVEPQFSKKSAEVLAKSIGGTVVPLDPLAPDYLENLKEIALKLDAALRAQKNQTGGMSLHHKLVRHSRLPKVTSSRTAAQ